MNNYNTISKEQFYEIFCSLKMKGISEFIPILENDIDLITKMVDISPLSYNYLNIKLKKNKKIIEATFKSFIDNELTGIDFYSLIENAENKADSFEEIFGDLSCKYGILKILVIDEYCCEKTTNLMDKYKDIVIKDDKLLNDIVTICGFVGFIKELYDNKEFVLRLIKINGDCLLLASDRLKKERSLILEAIKSKPMIAFKLDLKENDPIINVAINVIKQEADSYIELPCLYN